MSEFKNGDDVEWDGHTVHRPDALCKRK